MGDASIERVSYHLCCYIEIVVSSEVLPQSEGYARESQGAISASNIGGVIVARVAGGVCV